MEHPMRIDLRIQVFVLFGLAWPALAGIKKDDVNIGVDPAQNRLSLIWSGEAVVLPTLSGPLFGLGADEPGLITLGDPFDDLVPPSVGANLVLEVISFDAALKGWTPGFASIFQNPGDLFDLGPVPAHEHAFWHVDSTDPAFNPMQTQWTAMFRIIDTGSTGYLPSLPLEVTFTPEPAGLALLALGIGMGLGRRRRCL
jgi:hypothetical protein